MKFLVVFALIAAVASAGYVKPAVVDSAVSEVQEIIAAINSPSTDPATAAALEQMLLETLGISSAQDDAPISVGPAIVEGTAPISVGPAILDFPVPDGGAVTAEQPALVPAPVVDATPAAVAAADATTPLVQIILNINQASSGASVVSPAPVEAPVEGPVVSPVLVAEEAVNADSVVPTPVQVVDLAPEPVVVAGEPVQVAVLPEVPAAVNLPDVLN